LLESNWSWHFFSTEFDDAESAEYYFNPTWSIYARYEHTNFFSTDSGSDVLENEVRIGMRIRH